MPDKLLTTRELVDMLQLDRVTIYKMVKDGELASLSIPDHREVAKGTLRSLIRAAGLTVAEFQAAT